jgi:hypothetical protein
MKILAKMIAVGAAVVAVTGCSTPENLRLLREPALPPVAVAKATLGGPYYRDISIQEVHGAPEFRFFDGNGVINTRPTRAHMLSILEQDLSNSDMLADNRIESRYMLYIEVEDLKGPDVFVWTDKLASARVTFRLVNWRTGAVARQLTETAQFVAPYPGVTPEVGRAALAGAFLGGVTALAINDNIRASSSGGHGLTDLEATLAGGAYGFAVTGLAGADIQPTGALKGGYASEAQRRQFATNEVIHLLMDEFLHDLSKDGTITYKRAVSCQSLNPEKFVYSVRETLDAIGVDCPGARYTSSRLMEVGPSNFS